jgi:hypothetical protein
MTADTNQIESARRAALIARYRDGYAEIMRSLEGITDRELDTPEAEGEWSPRQIIHHLADSEMTAGVRLRMMVAYDQTEIIAYDPDLLANVLFYDRPIEHSLAAFQAARDSTAEILDRMSDLDWQSTARHSEVGTYRVESWLDVYSGHAHEHADQIRRARATAQRTA